MAGHVQSFREGITVMLDKAVMNTTYHLVDIEDTFFLQ